MTQESPSQSLGELSSSQVELNQNSKPPSRQSSCLSLNMAKVHPEVTSENQSAFTPVEIPNSSNGVGLECGDAGHGHHDSNREVLAASRREGPQSEIPSYKIYAMSVRCVQFSLASGVLGTLLVEGGCMHARHGQFSQVETRQKD